MQYELWDGGKWYEGKNTKYKEHTNFIVLCLKLMICELNG